MTARAGGLSSWWRTGEGGPGAYAVVRDREASHWRAAVASLPPDEGPVAAPPPDRPTALISDLPEIQAYRALLQDAGTPMDTLRRRVNAITQTAQDLDRRPLVWSAEEVAERCARLAESGSRVWTLLEATREFWAWHPDRAYAQAQGERLAAVLAQLEVTRSPSD